MWYLKRLGSPKTARDDLFYLRQGKHVVGRQTARCQLAFIDDPTLSREHATILVRYNNAVNPTENVNHAKQYFLHWISYGSNALDISQIID